MKCANCGAEMERGTLRYGNQLYYMPRNGELPFFGTRKELKKKNCIPLWRKTFTLGLNDEDWPAAYACRACRQIIIPYED